MNTASARVQKISEAVSCREARAARNAPCNNSSTPRDDVRVVGPRGRGLEPRRAEAEPRSVAEDVEGEGRGDRERADASERLAPIRLRLSSSFGEVYFVIRNSRSC